jgi:hypothetical protein
MNLGRSHLTESPDTRRAHPRRAHLWRARWAAIGAAAAVAVGAGAAVQVITAAPGASPPSSFVAVTPVRILDTRPAPENVGGFIGPIGTGGTHTFQVAGVAGVPLRATAVVMNVTVTDTSGDSFLTVWPGGTTRPTASNLNFSTGDTIPNLVTVRLGDTGQVSVYNKSGNTHVVADVAGYYVPSNDKFISIPVMSAVSSQPYEFYYNGVENVAGLEFGNYIHGGADAAAWNFVVPPDYTPGTTLRATITWSASAKGCSVTWAGDYAFVTRAGLKRIVNNTDAGDSASGLGGFGAVEAPTIIGQVATLTVTLDSPDVAMPLQPGDSYTFSIFRNSSLPSDTCVGGVFVHSVAITYE